MVERAQVTGIRLLALDGRGRLFHGGCVGLGHGGAVSLPRLHAQVSEQPWSKSSDQAHGANQIVNKREQVWDAQKICVTDCWRENQMRIVAQAVTPAVQHLGVKFIDKSILKDSRIADGIAKESIADLRGQRLKRWIRAYFL